MTNSLFLGFDGGATKTAGAALNQDKKLVAEAAGAAANFQIMGIKKASENIFVITDEGRKNQKRSLRVHPE